MNNQTSNGPGEEREFKSFLKTVGGNEGDRCNYPTRLDLYGCGCSHDCDYCYAKSLLDFRKMWNPSHPTTANWMKVQRAIRNKIKPGDVVRLGGMTDCFQPLERKRRCTYKAIEELNRIGAHYLIVTKSDLVADEEYLKILDKTLAHIQISVTFTDDAECAKHEKATPPLKAYGGYREAPRPRIRCHGSHITFHTGVRGRERNKQAEMRQDSRRVSARKHVDSQVV